MGSIMKVGLCVLFALFLLCQAEQIDKKEDCKCWEGFKPENEGSGWFCRGEKNSRIFGCNEDKPPICKCSVDGKIIDLDLGETNCQNGGWCHNREDFVEYFKKYPQYARYV